MTKIMVEFEDALIDINAIKAIDKKQGWNFKEDSMTFDIVINNPNRIKVDSFLPTYTFNFGSEEYRDRLLQELREKLEENGVEFV